VNPTVDTEDNNNQFTRAEQTRKSEFVCPSKPVAKQVLDVPIESIESYLAVGNNGRIFLSGKNAVFCLNTEAEILWTYKDQRYRFLSPVVNHSSNNIIVGTAGDYGSKGHKVFSFNLQGEILWEYVCNEAVTSTPVIDEQGNIYFTIDKSIIVLQSSGELKWQYDHSAPILTTPIITETNKIMIAASDENMIVLDSTGEIVEKYWVGYCGPNSYPLLDHSKRIIFKSCQKDEIIHLVNYDTEGKLNWAFQPQVGDITTSPSHAKDGSFLAGATYFQLFCVGKNGEEVWRTNVEGFMHCPPLIDGEGNIYTVSFKEVKRKMTSFLQSFSQNGKLKWSLRVEGVATAPVITDDGKMFLKSSLNLGFEGKTMVYQITEKPKRNFMGLRFL